MNPWGQSRGQEAASPTSLVRSKAFDKQKRPPALVISGRTTPRSNRMPDKINQTIWVVGRLDHDGGVDRLRDPLDDADARDRATQWTLGIFLGTFSYCMAALPAVRSLPRPFVPVLTVLVGMLLALLCVGWLIFFINHIARSISSTTSSTASRERPNSSSTN